MNLEEVPAQLKALRETYQLSQMEVASRMGIKCSLYMQIELRLHPRMTLSLLMRAFEALDHMVSLKFVLK
jgi:transcriptional regulator with XRE-family HTH domain